MVMIPGKAEIPRQGIGLESHDHGAEDDGPQHQDNQDRPQLSHGQTASDLSPADPKGRDPGRPPGWAWSAAGRHRRWNWRRPGSTAPGFRRSFPRGRPIAAPWIWAW